MSLLRDKIVPPIRQIASTWRVFIAGLALATLRIVTFYIFGQRFFVRGLVAGALKGQ